MRVDPSDAGGLRDVRKPARPVSPPAGWVTSDMPLGTSIFLIAVGAILRYAVTATTVGISIPTVGLILIIVGIVGVVLSLFWMIDLEPAPWRPRGTRSVRRTASVLRRLGSLSVSASGLPGGDVRPTGLVLGLAAS